MPLPDDETSLGKPDETVRLVPDADQTHLRSPDDTQLIGPPFGGLDSSTTFEPGTAFGKRYRIIKQLGAGGMGIVYQAWDEVLNVVVALKVIRPGTTADAHEARELERQFKRELLLARQVTHKHVVRIHDLGDVDGIKYITMSFVEGEDLVTTLKREGKLPVSRVVPLARQVASGLEAAHDAGVVHRDLKPANIMVDRDDEALIMDFGIALSATAKPRAAAGVVPPTGTASDATMAAVTVGGDPLAGVIIGTLDYMSPEQSRGGLVDHRSDIYTFGLILSDLLVGGRVRDPGTTPWQALTERISRPPVALSTRDPHVPAALDDVITRCLQLDPAQRFQKTGDLVRALGRLDDDGNLIPEARRLTPRVVVAASLLIAALLGTTWWLARGVPPASHEPVTVLIADFVNRSNDPVFAGVIEQALAVGVEGAGFITAYPRRDALRQAGHLKPGGTLDDAAAKLITLREGLDVIVGGDIEVRGDRYALRVHVRRPAPDPSAQDEVLLDWTTTADGRDQVLKAVGLMAARVRDALGDTTKAKVAASAAETFTAGSLESAKAYAEAQELQWAGRFEDAIAAYKRTLALDPNFGRAYAGMAALYANSNQPQEAEASYLSALGHLERMTEREKYRTRGGYYLFKRGNDKALREFEALVKDYPSDSSGLANLALVHFYLRDMKNARDFGQKASDLYPNNVIRKNNVALFSMYAGDFDTAERMAAEALALNPQYPKAFVARAGSQLAQGRNAEAAATYQQLAALDSPVAKSFAATGLIDLALYEGRQQDALKLLDGAIAVDRAAADRSAAGRRLATRAGLLAQRGTRAAAVRSAREALQAGKEDGTQYLAGLALIGAGESAAALEIAAQLDNQLEDEPRVHAALLRGEAALAAGRGREARDHFLEAQKLANTWLGIYGLGRSYLALQAFPEAMAEFDRCLTRRGEVTAVFLDDLPTYRLLPPVYYYLARAQEGMKNPRSVETYKIFLGLKAKGDEEGLVADARQRAGG